MACFAVESARLVPVVVWEMGAKAAGGPDSPASPASPGPTASTRASRPAVEGLNPAVYGWVAELRERLRLTDEAMAATAAATAAAGCDGPTAEAVLGRVLEWYQANAAAWDSRRSAVAAATVQLRQALGRMHAGPAALAAARD